MGRTHGRGATAVAAGLAAALALAPAAALAEGAWQRLAGQDAYGTMTEIVRAGAFEPGKVDTVVVATGEGFHDALCASGLAGITGAPVLITPTGSLGAEARAEIERLGPSTAYVVGGPMSVADAVLGEIAALGPKVERVSGRTAADTAVAAYKEVGGWGKTAVVAASSGYWDALAAAPYAYAEGAPLFLTGPDGTLGQATLDALRAGGFDRVLVAGGPQSVAADVEGQLAGISVDRRAGADALETSAAVAAFAAGEGMDASVLAVASSSSYHDALTGAALAGAQGHPLVLVDPEGGLKAYDAMREQGAATAGGLVFGGELSVSPAVYDYMANGTPLPEPTPEPAAEVIASGDGWRLEMPEYWRGKVEVISRDFWGANSSVSVCPLGTEHGSGTDLTVSEYPGAAPLRSGRWGGAQVASATLASGQAVTIETGAMGELLFTVKLGQGRTLELLSSDPWVLGYNDLMMFGANPGSEISVDSPFRYRCLQEVASCLYVE